MNALFSPASYLRVVESMQNILQISGLGDRGERSLGQDIHIEPKSRGTNPEPLCLKGLKDAWRQAMATEQLQDQHWARVKHLVLSIKSYSHWLTLLELLPRPDCEDGDFVRRLAETAKEEERTRMQSRGRSWKPSSETRYLQLAVAQHLGLPGGEKQWRDFEAHAHPAHVLHRHYGLLAIVSYKTLYVYFVHVYRSYDRTLSTPFFLLSSLSAFFPPSPLDLLFSRRHHGLASVI